MSKELFWLTEPITLVAASYYGMRVSSPPIIIASSGAMQLLSFRTLLSSIVGYVCEPPMTEGRKELRRMLSTSCFIIYEFSLNCTLASEGEYSSETPVVWSLVRPVEALCLDRL